jgi:hypothetical protein
MISSLEGPGFSFVSVMVAAPRVDFSSLIYEFLSFRVRFISAMADVRSVT